jgi:phenylpropionate dioxygenase-like ring-hydroxylating dioxygenase large terminal subunit
MGGVDSGWYQVAFRREIDAALTPVAIGAHRLMLVADDELHAYDATCPHRGAHLAYGGELDGHVVRCPFHGRRIALGRRDDARLAVAAHPTLDYGGCVFVLPHGRHDTGLADFLVGLAETHCFVPAFTLEAPVPPQIVIENVFDTDHFTAVHGIERRPELAVGPGVSGGLEVRAVFETAAVRPWGGEQDTTTITAARTSFLARVFSPGLVATEVGDPDEPQVVITAATARPGGGCVIRVTLALWQPTEAEAPDQREVMALALDSRLAFEQDLAIWEHLDVDALNHLDDLDHPVREFRAFCATFAR